MSTLTTPAERITAAGRSRAVASLSTVEHSFVECGAASVAEYAGRGGSAAGTTFRGWDANPVPVMAAAPQAISAKRHLTPSPRPEEASP